MRNWKTKDVPGRPKVGIAVAAYLNDNTVKLVPALRGLVSSFQQQTYDNWEMLVVHDGPCHLNVHEACRDVRISVTETAERKAKFGHPHRQAAVDRLLADGCEWVGLTNQDNYYAPVYLEWLLHTAIKSKALFVHCDMVHSHALWKPRATLIKRGHIDLGCFLAHKSVVSKIKFDKFEFAGDWDYIDRLVKAAKKKVAKVHASLFTHN